MHYLIIGGNYFRGMRGNAEITSIDAISIHSSEKECMSEFDKLSETNEFYGLNIVYLDIVDQKIVIKLKK